MLTIFPSLLWLGLAAPFLLRVTLGLVFLHASYLKLKKEKNERAELFQEIGLKPGIVYSQTLGYFEIILGLSLIAGYLTQISALISALLFGIIAFIKIFKKPSTMEKVGESGEYYLILTVISISLLFSGAGFLAFDLPL
ncbi:MAG: DoxX family protein [Candidatus Paceibacterota bacterium]